MTTFPSRDGGIPTRQAGLSLLDVATGAYLALPVLAFCMWFKPVFAMGLAAMLCYGFHRAMSGADWRRLDLPIPVLAALALLALAWVSLGGAGHFFYANHDWLTRDAVLRDLSLTGWPPSYETSQAAPLILRAPLGYYLPASLAGAAWGIHFANMALYVWTSLGFFLVLAGAVSLFETSRQRILCTALLLLFGGLDLPGQVMLWRTVPELGQHLEWWSGFAQYSSNSTLLYWVPNHALPAWLAMLLILRHWRKPELAGIAPLLGSCVPFWSPLAAIGSLPFFLLGINWCRDFRKIASLRTLLPSAVVALVCARYLTMGSAHIPGGWLFDGSNKGEAFLSLYAVFCLLEFGILAMVLLRLRAFGMAQTLAVIVLCLLPLYRFGYGNDFVMRASIPALLVLALATVRPLASAGPPVWRGALALVLAFGALGAAQEPIRALLLDRWEPTGMTLQEVSERVTPARGEAALPRTYVTHLDPPDMLAVMRPHSLVSSTLSAAALPSRGAQPTTAE